jgi:hypothetical protein
MLINTRDHLYIWCIMQYSCKVIFSLYKQYLILSYMDHIAIICKLFRQTGCGISMLLATSAVYQRNADRPLHENPIQKAQGTPTTR